LIKREIKISTFPDMNDPFELLGGLPVAPDIAHHFQAVINRLNGWCGVLCFSRDWQNALLWSHYADKHNGMCVGLDVGPKTQVSTPLHVKNRKKFDADMLTLLKAAKSLAAIKKSGKLPPNCVAAIRRLLLTKFEAWKYEDEVRVFCELKNEQKRGCHYFAELDDNFRPVSLMLGPRCRTSDREIESATSGYSAPIRVVRTVLAPNSFQVIEAS
jgi:Protein of unknown function (DUF2971)